MKDVDPVFRQGVGLQVGLEIWQIEDSQPKTLEKSQHGQFFTERSYIILQTCSCPTGRLRHDIHCWSGTCANQNDAATAAIKAVELNASLGGHAVQIYEKAGYESDRFLSYFKPCFVPFLQHTSFGHNTKTPYQTRMFLCEGKHVSRVKEVQFSRSSLNHDSIFVVDTQHKIFQFNGANTDMYERAKALDVVQYLMDNFHKEKCHIGLIEDGKFVADVDSGEFWALFGGFAPLMKKMEHGSHDIEPSSSKLHLIQDGQINKTEASPLRKVMLDGNKTYILECDNEVFTWMGQNTSLDDRKAAVLLAQELCSKKQDPHQTKLSCMNESFETTDFRAKFDLWPVCNKMHYSESGSGREKVAVLLKQRGFNIQGLLKPAPTIEKLPLMSSSGNLQVWCVDGGSKVCLPPSEMVKFNSKSCYVVLHSCSTNQNTEHFVYTWLSHQSSTDTRATAACHAKDIAASFQEKAIEVRIFQDKEPKQFLSLFNKLIVTKDGETAGSSALFQMHQSSPSKWRAVQTNTVAASLNSSSCFFLQTGDSIFIWYGKFTSVEEQEATKSMVRYLKPDTKLTILKEGAELQSFWSLLRGRQVYQSHHEPTESARSPRLFSITICKHQLKAIEVFNFTQDDFLSDEIMIVDCHTSIFVWIGATASTTMKLRALEIGQKYLDLTARYEGNSPETPIYRIQEGAEPLLFTSLFSWDSAKIKQYHNLFERKLLALKGEPKKQQEQAIKNKKLSPVSNGKGFQLLADKPKSTQKVTFKPEQPLSKFRQPKSKGLGTTPEQSGAISALSSMFEPQRGRAAPPNTPVVKLPALSMKPKGPIRESPPPTPSSRATPRTAISPAIASLTSVYESYNDRFAFAWPGMKLRHEERALSRDVDTFDFESVEVVDEDPDQQTPPSPIQARRDTAEEVEQQRYHSYERLKVSSGNPVLRIDSSKRESYLSNEEFQQVFLMDKDTFYKLPKWKQDKYKMLLDLF